MIYGYSAIGAPELGGRFVPITPFTPPVTQRFTLAIAGVDRSTLMLANTLKLMNNLSQTSTCTFTLWDPTSSFRPTIGQEIDVYSNTTKVFGGLVTAVDETAFSSKRGIVCGVTASGWDVLLDRRVVGGWFPSQLLSGLTTIVSNLVTTFLSADGIVYNSVDGDPGITLGDVLINWVTARQAFSQLSSLTGWDFNLDYNKTLRFFPPGTALGNAPFSIHDNDGNWLAEGTAGSVPGAMGASSMIVKTLSGLYRNREYVRSSSQNTPLWVDTFSATIPGPYPRSPQPPGGGRRAFITLFPLTAQPIIVINGVQVAVSRIITLNQIGSAAPSSWDWYWIPPQGFPTGGNGVFQNPYNTALATTDVLVVEYATKLPPVTVVTCPAQIAARAAAEGTSGYYDAVDDAPNVTEPVDLTQFATAILNRFGCTNGLQVQVLFSTIRDGLFCGQLININTSTPLVSNQNFLISQIRGTEVDKDHIRYDVTCDLGAYMGNNPQQLFAEMMQRTQLPQATALNQYTFQLAQTSSGSFGGIQNGSFVVQHQQELVLYISVSTTFTASQSNVIWQLLINSVGSLFVTFNAGDTGEKRAYQPAGQTPIKLNAGDLLQTEHSGNADSSLQFVNFTVVTAILVA